MFPLFLMLPVLLQVLKSTTVTFHSSPDVGTVIIPVNMIVAGEALNPVTNFSATLTSSLAGTVELDWI
ncbi:MAG: hypothetical protein IPH45_19460 [Bacteroidales bacterium]|nr:hypothetical protein [Bacteroidales bacterium]